MDPSDMITSEMNNKFFLDGPPEFILLALTLAIMAYLRLIMFKVVETLGDLKIYSDKKKKQKKKLQLQLQRLTKGQSRAAVLAGFILLRIWVHAIMFFPSLNWKPLENICSLKIIPVFVDFFILTYLFVLYLYLISLHREYDVRH